MFAAALFPYMKEGGKKGDFSCFYLCAEASLTGGAEINNRRSLKAKAKIDTSAAPPPPTSAEPSQEEAGIERATAAR